MNEIDSREEHLILTWFISSIIIEEIMFENRNSGNFPRHNPQLKALPCDISWAPFLAPSYRLYKNEWSR